MANAGSDQTVFVTNNVLLDGSGSSDVDGDGLTYTWSLITLPATSTTTLSATDVVNPWFVADVPGTYVAQLIVNDTSVDSVPNTVTITTQNSPPVADAGPDQPVDLGNTVQLDGSNSSDVDGDTLSYSWSLTTIPVSSTATLSAIDIANPTFVADLSGTYIAQLIVDDGNSSTHTDTVQIDTNNVAPVANAGTDQVVDQYDTVQLNGGGSSDADSDPLTYSWSLTSSPSGSSAALSATDIVNPTLYTDLPGTYIAQLIVNDTTVDSPADSVQITANVCNETTDFNDSTLQDWVVTRSGSTYPKAEFTSTDQMNGSTSIALEIIGTCCTDMWLNLTKSFGSSTYVYEISAIIRRDTIYAGTTGYLYVNGSQFDSTNFVPGSNTTHTVSWIIDQNVDSISFRWDGMRNGAIDDDDYFMDNIVINHCAP